MRQFYKHLANQEAPFVALAAAKRDMLQKYGEKAVPYYWAGFTFEGAADQATIHHYEMEKPNHVSEPAASNNHSSNH